ncbi:MAG: polysaccharide biosynthesis tyrosine autokinase [Chloroflexota bacterium]
MELREYYFIARHWLWLIVVCTFLGAAAGLALSRQMTPVYQASATLLVHRAPSGERSDYQDILTSERLARTYSEMVKGRPIMQEAVQRVGLAESAAGLADRVRVELVRDTQLIRVRAEHAEPMTAAAVANAVAEAFVSYTQTLHQNRYAGSMGSLERQLDGMSRLIEETEERIEASGSTSADKSSEEMHLDGILTEYRNTYATLVQAYEAGGLAAAGATDDVILFERAEKPASPIRPRTLMNVGLGGAVGLMIGVAAISLVDSLDDSVRSPEDLEQAAGLQTLGAISRFGVLRKLVLVDAPLSPASEEFRKLRTNLEFLGIERQLRSVLVTSAGPGEGKGLVAANLAAAAALAGRRVVLVAADLRRQNADGIFGRASAVGLTNALLEGRLDGKLQATEVEGLWYLGPGQRPPNPAEMLGSERMGEVLQKLLVQADLVVIDSAPVLPVADSVVLGQKVDGVLLIVDVQGASGSAVRDAAQSLRQAGANVVGAVLNNVPGRGSGHYGVYAAYGEGGDTCGRRSADGWHAKMRGLAARLGRAFNIRR